MRHRIASRRLFQTGFIGAWVLTLLLISGCVRSVAPILTDTQVINDNSVLGRWNSTDDAKESIEVLAGVDSAYKVLYHDKQDKTGNFVVRLGKVGDLVLAEIAPDEPANKDSDVYRAHLLPLYSFFWVVQTTPELKLRTISSDWLKKYVAAHPGELKTVGKPDDLVLGSTTEELQAFILKHSKDEGAWGDELKLVRPATK